MGQEKIVLQKDILKAVSNFLVSVVRFRPGHQESPKPPSGGFFIFIIPNYIKAKFKNKIQTTVISTSRPLTN
jgi:hypothetical protein